MSAALETQKALYEKLTGNSSLMAIISGVYDYVPENAVFPYVTIGNISSADNSAKGLKRYELNAEIGVYSQMSGRKQCLEIMEQIKTLVDEQSLNIDSFTHIFSKTVSTSTKQISDNFVVAGALTIKVFVSEDN